MEGRSNALKSKKLRGFTKVPISIMWLCVKLFVPRVVELSSVFKCMVASTDDSENPIPVPDFISRQIVLDLVEIIERGDTAQCAHLVLVSLSYLLDFLIAVDFLGFTEVKDTVEGRVKMQINDKTWKEVFHYTKDIIGLFNTTRHTIEYVCKRLQEGDLLKSPDKANSVPDHGPANPLSNQMAIMEQKAEARDPYLEDYLNFPAVFFKVKLRPHLSFRARPLT